MSQTWNPEAYAQHGSFVHSLAGGVVEWFKMFRSGIIDNLPESMRDPVVNETVELLANVLRDEKGNWTADYVRLRFIATASQRLSDESLKFIELLQSICRAELICS